MDRLFSLREEIARCRQSGLGPAQRYSATVVAGVARFAQKRLAQGVSLGAVSTELGLDRGTVERWTESSRSVESQALRRVQIAASVTAPAALGPTVDVGNVLVRTPSGVSIEGVDLAGAARLAAWLDRELR